MTGTRTGAVKPTMAEVVAQRRTEMSPGRRFFEAVAADGLAAAVDFDVTITLSDHGDRQIDLPPADQTVDAAQQPELAAQVGV